MLQAIRSRAMHGLLVAHLPASQAPCISPSTVRRLATRAAERKAAERKPSTRGLEHLTIECVAPELDCGRFPVKRIIGDVVEVGADIFKEGHDLLAARLLFQGPADVEWRTAPMVFDYDTDRWYAAFTADRVGQWVFTVEG